MKNLIAFRPDKDLEKSFSTKLALLGVSESEFARRSVRHGMDRAFEELAAEQRKDAEALIARLKLPVSAAALAAIAPMSALMASGCSERDNGNRAHSLAVKQVNGIHQSVVRLHVGPGQSVRKGFSNGDDALPGVPGSTGIQADARRCLRRRQHCSK